MNPLFEKPFLLSIGPQRAGTHFLYEYFQARDDVCLPAGVKEIFFFDRHFQRGSGFYTNHFPVRDQHQLIADLSTTTFDHPDAPARVHDLFGKDISLTCPLREPVSRSLAVYEDYIRYGIVSGGIEEAVEQAPQILFASRYADHLERWFEVFGKDNVQILFYEEGLADQEAYLKQVCSYAGLPYAEIKQSQDFRDVLRNMVKKIKPPKLASAASIKKKNEAHNWLKQRLFSEILKLENLLGRPLPHWKH